jgi:hypothetical protein
MVMRDPVGVDLSSFDSSKSISMLVAEKQSCTLIEDPNPLKVMDSVDKEPEMVTGVVMVTVGTVTIGFLAVHTPPRHVYAGDGGFPTQSVVLGLIRAQMLIQSLDDLVLGSWKMKEVTKNDSRGWNFVGSNTIADDDEVDEVDSVVMFPQW